ncbi:hypothetical protein BKH43_04210 [Helicobacter sp. 13S00401-1]|nr:hypothetical protein BKH43_04210 [Helicobacter sp. 13S00401-1]
MKSFRSFITKALNLFKIISLTSFDFKKTPPFSRGFKQAFIMPDLIYALIITALSYYTIFLLQSHITNALSLPLFTNNMQAKEALLKEVASNSALSTKQTTANALSFEVKNYSVLVGNESLNYIKFESID